MSIGVTNELSTVGTSQIVDGAVTSAKIAAGAVVAASIAAAAVGTAAISSGSATSGQVLQANGSGAVTFATPSTGALTLISSNTVGTATQTLTLSSIPQSYSMLRLVIKDLYSSTTTSEQMEIRINGLSTSTYGNQRLRGSNATADAQRVTDDPYLFFPGFNELAGSSAKVGTFAVLDFYNYTNTSKAKYGSGIICTGSLTTNAMSAVSVIAFMNATTSAITSLDFVSISATNLIAVGSKFDLYGVS